MAYSKWTHEDDARLIALLAEGKTVKAAAEELGRDPQAVHSHMNYKGITKKSVLAKVRAAKQELHAEAEAIRLAASEQDLARYLPPEGEEVS